MTYGPYITVSLVLAFLWVGLSWAASQDIEESEMPVLAPIDVTANRLELAEESAPLRLALSPGQVLHYRAVATRHRALTQNQKVRFRCRYRYPHDRVEMRFECDQNYYVLDVDDRDVRTLGLTQDIRMSTPTPLVGGPQQQTLKTLSLIHTRPNGEITAYHGNVAGFTGVYCGLSPVVFAEASSPTGAVKSSCPFGRPVPKDIRLRMLVRVDGCAPL